MFKSWLYNFKEKLEQDKIKEDSYVDKKENEAKERIENSNKSNKSNNSNNEMISKCCPFIDGLCIGSECAHFTSAYYFYSDDQMFEGIFGNTASCKLWGR